LVISDKDTVVVDNTRADSADTTDIIYSVLVTVQGENSYSAKSTNETNGVSGAIVSINIDGEVTSVTTDASGIAAFNKLRANNIAVSVRLSSHTTANFIVDLNDESTTPRDKKYASSIVTLLPQADLGTAHIKGKLFAELDATNSSYENVPTGTNLTAIIDYNTMNVDNPSSNNTTYINHEGVGKITQFYFENIKGSTTVSVQEAGEYDITVPACCYGFRIEVHPSEFEYDQIVGQDGQGNPTYSRTVYTLNTFTEIVYPNKTIYHDDYYYEK